VVKAGIDPQAGNSTPKDFSPVSIAICGACRAFGTALFQRVCELDLEGIVAKQKSAPHVAEREQSTWFKILNREYPQKDGREELFERERHSEPVPGWHSCALACTELEENA